MLFALQDQIWIGLEGEVGEDKLDMEQCIKSSSLTMNKWLSALAVCADNVYVQEALLNALQQVK